MAKLTGTKPDQVPTNADLGDMAYQDRSSLATVATSGAYADITGTPSSDDLLPSQTGNATFYLTTNGTTATWAAVAAGAPFSGFGS